ncbi:hypothetical protein L2E82_48983 [Cichorium intybus]|uniref:Uncharacterized protein n=1 Tax=Cichorium intybus TaxID=13427 RepID=A0ACB8Z098_CICIN|nr:hypothetical protein L2E82_48983 [Cichorium intybus]
MLSKDKRISFWASPRPQMNFDTYDGGCTSPSTADQMLASFALSAGYAPYDYTNFTKQVKSTFLPSDGEITGERVAFFPPQIPNSPYLSIHLMKMAIHVNRKTFKKTYPESSIGR